MRKGRFGSSAISSLAPGARSRNVISGRRSQALRITPASMLRSAPIVRFKDLASRIAGVSIPVFGSWNPPETEREIEVTASAQQSIRDEYPRQKRLFTARLDVATQLRVCT
jgi:hypothetical protein